MEVYNCVINKPHVRTKAVVEVALGVNQIAPFCLARWFAASQIKLNQVKIKFDI